jgi:hypothetical protein
MEYRLTEIAVVLGRFGSIESARTDTIENFNAFLAEPVASCGAAALDAAPGLQ